MGDLRPLVVGVTDLVEELSAAIIAQLLTAGDRVFEQLAQVM